MSAQDNQRRVQADRRLNLRKPLIVLQARMEDDTKSFFGYAKNISRGGMFIASVNPKEPGSHFKVEFPLPGPEGVHIACSCEVVWKRSYSPKAIYEPGMGLKFVDLSDDVADAIEKWVHSHLPT
jgi:uncharacterized protein (TIGR02266 family)